MARFDGRKQLCFLQTLRATGLLRLGCAAALCQPVAVGRAAPPGGFGSNGLPFMCVFVRADLMPLRSAITSTVIVSPNAGMTSVARCAVGPSAAPGHARAEEHRAAETVFA